MSSLEKIEWSESLSIGNLSVDKDHKKLIDIYNALVDLVEFKKSKNEFSRILSEMTDYSLLHFKKEEAYMKAFKYPEVSAHIQSHMAYIYKVSMFNIELSRFSTVDPKEVIEFLEKWWVNHIIEKDTEYEKYRKSIKSNEAYKSF
jgi:hemerythrin